MKYELLNNCERNISESLPDVIRFNLGPGDKIVVTKSEYDAICLARGLRGMTDLVVTEILEDAEVVEAIKTETKKTSKKKS